MSYSVDSMPESQRKNYIACKCKLRLGDIVEIYVSNSYGRWTVSHVKSTSTARAQVIAIRDHAVKSNRAGSILIGHHGNEFRSWTLRIDDEYYADTRRSKNAATFKYAYWLDDCDVLIHRIYHNQKTL